jgi:hypothetical protein
LIATDKQIEGHYDVQEVPFGTVYKWRPKHVVMECGCGKRLVNSAYSATTCRRCGAEHLANLPTSNIPEEPSDGRLTDEILHPWRYVKDREEAGLPF